MYIYGESDANKDLKAFIYICSEMQVSLLMLRGDIFSCLQMYNQKLLNIYFKKYICVPGIQVSCIEK